MLPLIFGRKPVPYVHATGGGLYSHGDSTANALNGGHGNLTDRNSPLQIGALTTWKAFAQCQSSTIAYKSDGTLWSFGFNSSGQLGNSTTTAHSSPEQIGALTNWGRQIGGGGAHHIAIKTDGTAWAWGYGGQFIYVLPDLDAVIVVTSSPNPGDGRRGHRRALNGLIEHELVPAIRDAVNSSKKGL